MAIKAATQAMSNPYSTMVGASSSRANWQAALRSLFMVVSFRSEGRWSRTNHQLSTSRAKCDARRRCSIVTVCRRVVCGLFLLFVSARAPEAVWMLPCNSNRRALRISNMLRRALSTDRVGRIRDAPFPAIARSGSAVRRIVSRSETAT
jgi:hypothetical protein